MAILDLILHVHLLDHIYLEREGGTSWFFTFITWQPLPERLSFRILFTFLGLLAHEDKSRTINRKQHSATPQKNRIHKQLTLKLRYIPFSTQAPMLFIPIMSIIIQLTRFYLQYSVPKSEIEGDCNKLTRCFCICWDTHSENYLFKIGRAFSRCFQTNFKIPHQYETNPNVRDQNLNISSFDTETLVRLVAKC